MFQNVLRGFPPAIFPIADGLSVCGAAQNPSGGLGGIAGWQDAAVLMAGATAVQVGEPQIIKPISALDIIDGLEQFLKDQLPLS